jgi:hypothetical protein
VGKVRGRKVKSLGVYQEGDIFWMSLEEAKRAIQDKYEGMVDRYERKMSKTKENGVKKAAA